MIRHTLLTLSFIFLLTPLYASAEHPRSFSHAKVLAKQIYAGHLRTFYCDCDISVTGKKWSPIPSGCGYEPRLPVTRSGKPNNRATRIEWEHVVPAWVLGHQRQCWQNGGRKACKKNDAVFRTMEADLYNLVPTIGELNQDRGHFKFGMIHGEPRNYGQCDFEVDFKAGVVEPPPHRRGDIARIYFYMEDRYQIRLSKQQLQLLYVWSNTDRVDAWECERAKRIEAIQGNPNPFVTQHCH